MQIFEFHCDGCGLDFGKFMPSTETEVSPECPTCHGADTHKKVFLPGQLAWPTFDLSSLDDDSCGGSGSFT